MHRISSSRIWQMILFVSLSLVLFLISCTPTSAGMQPPSRPTLPPNVPSAVPAQVPSAVPAPTPTTALPQSILTYPIVDTGQTTCYDSQAVIPCPDVGSAFYGQDAQHNGRTPSYMLSENGLTVTDQVTGLTWERSPDTNGDNTINVNDKLTVSGAEAYCANLSSTTYQGYNDWRLPSIKELYSLINFQGTDPSGVSGTDTSSFIPFIDTNVFIFSYGDTSANERLIDAQYASSTFYATNPSGSPQPKLFGVNFADGRIKGYDLYLPDIAEKTFFVQCVRGNTDYGVNAFVDHGDQTITDQATGLMWSQSDSGMAMTWQEALAWVAAKNAESYLGYNDWRLPNAKELQSILDYTRSPDTTNSAAIDPIFEATAFTNEGGETDWPSYWSSTTHISLHNGGIYGVYVAFGRATGWMKRPPSASCYTLVDVHGAGAQRSDPKTGNLQQIGQSCDGSTAYGFGPQGDVLRSRHYVRLVRDAASDSGDADIQGRVYLPLVACS